MTDNKYAEAVEVTGADLDAARPFMDRYLDGSSFCDDRVDLAVAFARHRLAALNTRPDVEAMREACIKACEEQQQVFLSPQYATGQPLSSMQERFACGRCIDAIRSIPVPTSGEGGAD